MAANSQVFPALYVIFTLLNAVRRRIPARMIWREFRRQKIALKPRLAFWVAVCKQAGLIKEIDGDLRVTSLARAWLNTSSEQQTFSLIRSWQEAPRNHKARQFRKKLLWKLKFDKELTRKDLSVINGLEALGLILNQRLTAWGRYFIKGEGALPVPKTVAPCQIVDGEFITNLPHHIDLLWDLEMYLRPRTPGRYDLHRKRQQPYDKDVYDLIHLLEAGLQAELPAKLRSTILNQPSIRIVQGVILEFSSPAELAQLRRQPNFRQYIEEFLSPRSILVSGQKAALFFKLLARRGVFLHEDTGDEKLSKKRTHFSQKNILPPLGKSVPKLSLLEKYKQLGQALDVWYRAPGYPAELRRITPLLIEERAGASYLIAYCQTRRAQRTFRLDRMEIPGTY